MILIEEDVLLLDGLSGELHWLAPRPMAAGEAHFVDDGGGVGRWAEGNELIR